MYLHIFCLATSAGYSDGPGGLLKMVKMICRQLVVVIMRRSLLSSQCDLLPVVDVKNVHLHGLFTGSILDPS